MRPSLQKRVSPSPWRRVADCLGKAEFLGHLPEPEFDGRAYPRALDQIGMGQED